MKPAEYRVLVATGFNRFSDGLFARQVTMGNMSAGVIIEELEHASKMHDTVLIFDGGADVSPALYGRPNLHSMCDPTRDMREVFIYNVARALGNIPIFAFCRGHQFIAAMNGMPLVQDIELQLGIRSHNHDGTIGGHGILPVGDTFREMFANSPFGENRVSSTHHQCVSTHLVEGKATVIATDKTGNIVEGLLYDFGMTLQCHPEFRDWREPVDWVANTFLQ